LGRFIFCARSALRRGFHDDAGVPGPDAEETRVALIKHAVRNLRRGQAQFERGLLDGLVDRRGVKLYTVRHFFFFLRFLFATLAACLAISS
jgi:hypothetical protein